jgi:phenolic acid decarboxylase
MAAQNSQTFYLAAPARAGNVQLPRGIYEVTWSAPSKSRVTLIIKTEDEKTFKILSRVIVGKQDRIGVVTSVVDGVSYLQELHTSYAKFILQNKIEGFK